MTFDWNSRDDEDDFDLDNLFDFDKHHNHDHSAADQTMGILGSVVGFVLTGAVVVLVVYCCCCRKKRNSGVVIATAHPPPPPPAANTLPSSAYPRQEYVQQTVSPYPHNVTIQTSPAPIQYPTGYPAAPSAYPVNPPYPTANPPYPAANPPYPTTTGYPATTATGYPAPYPTTTGYPGGEMFPSAPTAPQIDALPPTYDQAVGEKHPPYNPHVR